MEKQNSDGFELFDDLEKDINIASDESVIYDDMQCETSTFSDSGLSSDLQEMSDQILSDDELLKSILDSSPRDEISAESIIQPEISESIVMPATPVEDIQPFAAPKSPIIEEKPKVISKLIHHFLLNSVLYIFFFQTSLNRCRNHSKS